MPSKGSSDLPINVETALVQYLLNPSSPQDEKFCRFCSANTALFGLSNTKRRLQVRNRHYYLSNHPNSLASAAKSLIFDPDSLSQDHSRTPASSPQHRPQETLDATTMVLATTTALATTNNNTTNNNADYDTQAFLNFDARRNVGPVSIFKAQTTHTLGGGEGGRSKYAFEF
jgi:hypothetical protein